MRSIHTWWAVVVGASLALGCVGGSKGLSSEDKDRLKAFVLDSTPADIPHKIDINFENKVHLIGWKAEPETAKPGTDVKVTLWWRCDDSVEDGWKIFTHVEDDGQPKGSNGIGNLDDKSPIREEKNDKQILGPDRWEKGKVYVDELQGYHVPDQLKGQTITFYVGIWKGDARLRIINSPNDGDNRAPVLQLKTGVTEEQHTQNDNTPSVTLTKLAAGDKINVDGKADDKAWGGAGSTGPFVDVGNGTAVAATAPVQGSVKLAYDDDNLYAFFDVKDPDYYEGFKDAKAQPGDFTATGQPKLWTKDTVEMMVDPDPSGDNKDYYELQINPQNKVFKSQFDSYNSPRVEPNGPYGHEDWDPKLKSATQPKFEGGKKVGYTVEVAIPWAAYSKAASSPPKPGDVWRINFYAMKNNGGVAWSPILGQGNFHKASRFGRVQFGQAAAPAGSASAAASASAAPSSSVALPRPLPIHRTPVMQPPQ